MYACEFIVRGSHIGKPKTGPCKQPGAPMWIHGRNGFTQIRMVLCERHKNHVTSAYGWTVTPDAETK